VSAYNGAADELAKHRGESAGALAGQSIVSSAAAALRQLSAYATGTGTIDSLTALGLEFDAEGRLSFDTTAFSTATTGRFAALSAFLGNSGSQGNGFLKVATDTLNGLQDVTSGLVKTSISSLKTQISRQDSAIGDAQERIDLLQKNLMNQMAAADALIAGLEQKSGYMGTLFESMRLASQTYK
jgi:flagellar capping protein FliD